MSEASIAVFLSYASQDAEAARRIADALRAAGIEVWFDQSELVGGDAWDQKIRKQIKECALFLPVISVATQARREGYFRLEWRLAVDRMQHMDDDLPFLLPVVIDGTRDAEAFVPERFRAVQWTRLPNGETPSAFALRVAKLLGGVPAAVTAPETKGRAAIPGAGGPPPRKAWLVPAVIGALALGALVLWQPWHGLARPPAPATPAVSAASSELAQIRARIVPDRWLKEDYEVASAALDRLIKANLEEADAWALRSIVNSLQSLRNFDPGTKPLEVGQAAAVRALRLAPGSPLGELARGMHLTAMISRGGDPAAGRPFIDRAVAALPPDALTRFADVALRLFGYDFAGVERASKAWLQAEPDASYPQWILAIGYLANRRLAEAEEWSERAARNPGNTGSRALGTLFAVKFFLRADLEAARAVLDRVSADGRSVHRIVYFRWLQAMAEHHWDAALQVLAQVPEPVIGDVVYHGPKALLAGQAHQRAGRAEAATAQFTEAERQLRELLVTDPDNEELHAVLALTFASAGRGADARNELSLIEPLVKERPATAFRSTLVALLGETRGRLGDFDDEAFWLRKLLTEPSNFPFTPASLRLDPRFAGTLEAPPLHALLRELAALDRPLAAGAANADDKSVAVLAFANLSDDKANEYFSDGISEELLNVLAKVPGLKVTARTSSFHFKGMNTAIPEIAQQLGVAYVIEGSVRKQGDKVRITAQLIKAADGFHVWSDTFTRDLKDIFAVQDEIAGLIAQQLSLKLAAPSVTTRASINPEAYRLYLEGRQAWRLRSTEALARAEQLFKRALELEPDFARAIAGLADTQLISRQLELSKRAHRNSSERAGIIAQAQRALEMDSSLAEAHATIGLAHALGWQFESADRKFHRALELDPTYASAHQWRGRLLLANGRADEALAESAQAVEADALAPRVLGNAAVVYLRCGRYAQALEFAERALRLQPGPSQQLNIKAEALMQLGRPEEALRLAREAMTAMDENIGTYMVVFARTGGTADEIRRCEAAYKSDKVISRLRLALAQGRNDEALALLAAQLGDITIFDAESLLFDSLFDALRGDARFRSILTQLELTEASDRAQAWRAAHPPEKPEAKK